MHSPGSFKRLLVKENGEYVKDDFRHEHFLVINDGNKKILMSGCAHNGILSILDAYKEKYDSYPDVVISGFHLMKKTEYTDDELREVLDIGRKLTKYPTLFYTCHCTGQRQYGVMKKYMDSLNYISAGDTIVV